MSITLDPGPNPGLGPAVAAGSNVNWPVLTRYEGQALRKIALPIGGIGTGTVSLGGRGNLQDFEVVNRPAKGFTPQHSFFALYARPEGGEAVTRALEGPLDTMLYEGARGSTEPNHSLPRFRNCSCECAYPFGQVLLSDPTVPVEVSLQAYNPLIPADAERSGIPVAIFRFVLTNTLDKAVDVSVCGSIQNFIGSDGSTNAPRRNVNGYRSALQRPILQGIFMRSEGVDPDAEQWGTMALATTAADAVTYRTSWLQLNWGGGLLDFWDDFSADGKLEPRDNAGIDAPVASLAVQLRLAPREVRPVTFLYGWHFPNRMTWTPVDAATGSTAQTTACCEDGACYEQNANPNIIGNYYATRYRDAWDVVSRTAAELESLERDTMTFATAFCSSVLPTAVKEAALNNISTLRTQTAFRTPDGNFFGWEGCDDTRGCCHGTCTHVWNYEQATAFLFGDLARSMRKVEFVDATDENGLMSFRINLPLSHARDWKLAAADGQMGCIMKLYRDWQLSGDDALLRTLWPKVRKALEFCWIPGGWDADRDGVMEGCQHNTMDVEYYGPNPQMTGWYLGALRAAEEMARYLGETEFAETCHTLFENGSIWSDRNLFNGDYYEHQIRPAEDESAIAPGLRHSSMGARDLRNPELQLGAGCLIDQLVGQYMAHVCGLGYLFEKEHIDKTLHSLMVNNFKDNLYGHFNYMRSYALNDEAAMLMATYPKGRRPQRPFPYSNEVMTGFEYTAAVHMLYEGQMQDGLKLIGAVRARYDGNKRSPFDEAECGHHYARAMASWAALLALSGFHYSGVAQAMGFTAAGQPTVVFWSNGQAWGTCRQTPGAQGVEVELEVLYGSLTLKQFELAGTGSAAFEQAVSITPGNPLHLEIRTVSAGQASQ